MGNAPTTPKKTKDERSSSGFRVSTAVGATDRIVAASTRGNASFCKVCVVGESQTGKTSVANWLARKPFESTWKPTVGVDHVNTTLTSGDQHAWKVQLWDSAGVEKYRINTATFYEGAGAAIVVVDTTKPAWDGIGNAAMWRDQLLLHTKNDFTPIIIVGTRAGFTEERKLHKADLMDFLLSTNAHYVEVECSQNDEDLRTLLTELVVNNVPEKAITRL
eukprot:TRINITY_DN17385_c0_g1_i1.p1 TRINITY_DN17385_c0_g1~~TRINITY_DN17385_c0_g1_i1.p1  ORF type:complete len:219 (+),score=55.42 TRINITY_DN17385_c0_g1_i1:174-830(+)